MGGKTPTSWKPGQSGNPAGRPKETAEDKVAKSVVAPAAGITAQDLPAVRVSGREVSERRAADTGGRTEPEIIRTIKKLTDAQVREGLRALLPAALLRMERDIMSGGEKASQQARYVLDQVIGKPTETVKHTGEGPGWEIKWTRLADRAVKTDQPVN